MPVLLGCWAARAVLAAHESRLFRIRKPHSCLLQHVDALTPAHREDGLPPVWDLVYQAGLQLACTAGCEELMGSMAASCQHYAQVQAPWHSTGFGGVGCNPPNCLHVQRLRDSISTAEVLAFLNAAKCCCGGLCTTSRATVMCLTGLIPRWEGGVLCTWCEPALCALVQLQPQTATGVPVATATLP